MQIKRFFSVNQSCNSVCKLLFLLILVILILFFDINTGREIRLIYLLVIPISLASLLNFKVLALLLSIFIPFSRLLFFIYWDVKDELYIGLVNAVVRSLVLLFICYFSYKARLYYELSNKLELEKLQKKIKILEGILPICSNCKKIRNKQGNFEVMELYISKHSEAEFSHTLCSDCLKKLYPDYSQEIK